MEPRALVPTDDIPAHGSVVMTQGLTGTAFQRHHSDGLFHSSTGQVKRFSDLFHSADGRPVATYLVHDASDEAISTLGAFLR